MVRTLLAVLLVLIAAVVVVGLRGDAGAADVTWLGWSLRSTAAAAALMLIFVTLIASVLWRGLIWLAETPQRAERARAESRRRQGADALSRGFLAAASGDGAEARRQAQRAAGLVDDIPALVRLLAAKAAEASDDAAATRTAYTAMLSFPELRLAAHRGLMQAALSEGDADEAQRQAEAAFALARTAPWAWRAVLESRLAAGDWTAALQLMQGALDRKIVSPIVAERARCALLTASAAGSEDDTASKSREKALDDAQTAARLRPDFIPASVIAARLLAADGRQARAAQILETAWRAAPHPALWLAYRDLRTDETPRERAARLASLAGFRPESREARMLMAEQALIATDPVGARGALRELDPEPLTRRLAGLRARVANLAGDRDEARAWIARGGEAPLEPDWSDVDPDGRAFNYAPEDWARLAVAYAERGELIHPRFDRGERSLGDLPDLPAAYVDSAPFVSAAAAGGAAPPIVDDGGFAEFGAEGDTFPPAEIEPAPTPPRRRRAFSSRDKGR